MDNSKTLVPSPTASKPSKLNPYLRLQADKLSQYESRKLLEDAENKMIAEDKYQTEYIHNPDNGDVYLCVTITNKKNIPPKDKHNFFLNDQLFLSSPTQKKLKGTGIIRTWFRGNKKIQAKSNFRKYFDRLESSDNSDRQAILIGYLGDKENHMQQVRVCHQNIKDKLNQPARVRQSVKSRKKIISQIALGPKSIQNLIKHNVAQGEEKLADQNQSIKNIEIVDNPNIYYYEQRKQKAKLRIYPDDIYSIYELCQQEFAPMILKFQLYPSFAVIFTHPKLFEITENLLDLISKFPDAPFQFAYDTTFNVGKFYLSPILFRNFLIEGNPVYPVCFMLHDQRYSSVHTLHWDVFATRLGKKLESHSNCIPITLDREHGITNAIEATFKESQLSIVYCVFHLKQNFLYKIKQLEKDSLLQKSYMNTLNTLFALETEAEYTTYLKEAFKIWSAPVQKYYKKNIHKSYITKSAPWIVNKYTAFKDMTATNNISEAFNSRIIQQSELKSTTNIDLALFNLYHDCCFYLKQFIDVYTNVSNRRKYASNLSWNRITETAFREKQLKFGLRLKEDFHTKEGLMEKIKKCVPYPEDPNAVLPNFGCSQLILATMIPENQKLYIIEDKRAFVVPSAISNEKYLVQYIKEKSNLKAKLECSCGSRRSCAHKQVVLKYQGLDQEVIKNQKASQIRRSSRFKGTSGKKGPLPKEPTQVPVITGYKNKLAEDKVKEFENSDSDEPTSDSSSSEWENIVNRTTISIGDVTKVVLNTDNDVTDDETSSKMSIEEENDSPVYAPQNITQGDEPFEMLSSTMDLDKTQDYTVPFEESLQSNSQQVFNETVSTDENKNTNFGQQNISVDLDTTKIIYKELTPDNTDDIEKGTPLLKRKRLDEPGIKTSEREVCRKRMELYDFVEPENKKFRFYKGESNDQAISYVEAENILTRLKTKVDSNDPVFESLSANKFIDGHILEWYVVQLLRTTSFKPPTWLLPYNHHVNILSQMDRQSLRELLKGKIPLDQCSIFKTIYLGGFATMSIVFEIFNINNLHWITLVYCFQSKEILLFDSLYGNGVETYTKYLIEGLQFVFLSFAYANIDPKNELKKWKCVIVKDTPRQTGNDCGLFCVFNIYSILKKRSYIESSGGSDHVRNFFYQELIDKQNELGANYRETTQYIKDLEKIPFKNLKDKEVMIQGLKLIGYPFRLIELREMSSEIEFLLDKELYGNKLAKLSLCINVDQCNHNKEQPLTIINTCIVCRSKYHCECLKFIERSKQKSVRFFVCNCVKISH